MAKPTVEQLQEIDQLKDELHPAIQFDYTGQIEQAMADHWDNCETVYKMRLPARQYMWDLYSVSASQHINEHLVRYRKDYPKDVYTSMSDMELIELAKERLNNILTGKHDEPIISEEQVDVSTYPFTDAQKLLQLIEVGYLCSIAYIKLRGYEDLFTIPPRPVEKENDDDLPE